MVAPPHRGRRRLGAQARGLAHLHRGAVRSVGGRAVRSPYRGGAGAGCSADRLTCAPARHGSVLAAHVRLSRSVGDSGWWRAPRAGAPALWGRALGGRRHGLLTSPGWRRGLGARRTAGGARRGDSARCSRRTFGSPAPSETALGAGPTVSLTRIVSRALCRRPHGLAHRIGVRRGLGARADALTRGGETPARCPGGRFGSPGRRSCAGGVLCGAGARNIRSALVRSCVPDLCR